MPSAGDGQRQPNKAVGPRVSPGPPERQMMHVRLSKSGLHKIDEKRGSWSRSEYLRQALALAMKQGLKGPEPIEWE